MKKTIILIVCALVVSLGATATVGIVSNTRTYSADETYSAEEIDALVLSLQQQIATDKNLLDKQIETLTKGYKEKDAELLATITENQKAISALDTKYAVDVALLEKSDADNKQALDDLTATYNAKVAELTAADQANETALAELKATYEAKASELQQADKDNADALDKLKTEYNAKVAELETAINAANQTIESNKTELENKITALTNVYTAKMTEIDSLLETIQSKDTTQDAKIAELAEEIVNLQNATRITNVAFDDNGDLLITFGDGTTQTVNAPEKHVHTYGDYVTFTSTEGNKFLYRVCLECKAVDLKMDECSVHNWNVVTTAPTCQAQGYDTKTCKICGKVEIENYVDKVDHSWQTTYSYDNDYHWYDCSTCDDVKDKAEHTVDDSGLCTICNNLVGATAGVVYTLSTDGTHYSVTDYQGTATRVRIADTYNNLPVTEIASAAFYGNETATEVFIPDSVTTIASTAFKDCTNLTSIRLSDNLEQIGDSAFYNCKKLASITIPDSVTSIGSYAFSNCSSLKGVYITDIAAWCNIEFSDYASNPLYYAHNLYLNSELVTSLSIPSGVTAIKNYAFYSATCLTNITIPNSVTSISVTAFSGCTNLIKNIKGIHYVGNWVIDSDTDIVNANIMDGTRGIADTAFYNCRNLTSVTIPNSVTSIGNYAFSGCSSLKGVYITDIAAWCNIEFNNDYSNPLCWANNLYLNNELVTDLVIPNTITAIKDYVFYRTTCLTSITIPDSVTSIGDSAFWYCSSLTSIIIPDSVTSIGDDAFYGCSCLTSITIPDSVTSIGRYAFYNCSSLTSVYITDIAAWCNIEFNSSVSNPLYYANNLYLNNESVTDLVIPNTVTAIKDYAFIGATCLKNVTIPDSVTSIGNSAFGGCSSLASVTIPDSVTSIGNYAFYDCRSLTSIVFEDTTTWYVTDNAGYWQNKVGGNETSVADAFQNTIYFKSTYYDYYWYKI